MRSPKIILRFVAKAVINAASAGLPVGDFLIDVLPEIAKDVYNAWGEPRSTEERRDEIEALLQVPDSDAPRIAEEIVAEVAEGQPEAVRQLLIGYLTMVPAAARASLRRHSDPSGTTVPADAIPRSAADLTRLLPTRLPRFKSNERLGGLDWVLERFLGAGGFGEVWKARHAYQLSRKPVAIKFCNDEAASKLLHNEVNLIDRLMGPGLSSGVVRLLDTHLGSEPRCLIYEYVEGGDLTRLIHSWHSENKAPTPHEAADVVRRLAEIIGTAHQLDPPIVHRDLKPANILIESIIDGIPQFKVTDFGIGGLATRNAVQYSQRGTTKNQFLVSSLRGSFTPLYASPQQSAGADPDPRDDVFSIGVIWFQLLNGRLEQGRPSGTKWITKLQARGMSNELINLLTSCFEEEPEDRPDNAAALARQIATLIKSPTPEPRDRVEAEAEPKTAGEYIERGNARKDKGDPDAAIGDYDHAIRLDPKYAEAYYKRGSACHDKGNLDAAIGDYDHAIRLDPKDDIAYFSRGSVHHDKGDFDAAIGDYDHVIRLNPKYSDAYYNRGLVRKAKGDLTGAIEDMKVGSRLAPDDPDFQKQIAKWTSS